MLSVPYHVIQRLDTLMPIGSRSTRKDSCCQRSLKGPSFCPGHTCGYKYLPAVVIRLAQPVSESLPLFTKRRYTASSCSVNQSGDKFEVINSNKFAAMIRSSICEIILPCQQI